MHKKEFFCFFNNINDFFQGHQIIRFGVRLTDNDPIRYDYHFSKGKYFILYDSLECGDKNIIVENGNCFFCFSFFIKDYFPKKLSKKEFDNLVNKVQNLYLFTDKRKNNYICSFEDLKMNFNFDYELKNAIYLFNYIELIQYSYNHNFFSLNSVLKFLKPHIQGILNISKKSIEILKNYHLFNHPIE